MPTNDWWSSLAWEALSSPMFPHPLAVHAQAGGLSVFYPGTSIVANVHGIIGGSGNDIVIGHSAVTEFNEARVDDFSDWFVTASFQSGTSELRTTYGHGSPFVYVECEGGSPTVRFSETPVVWSGNANDAVLGISVANRHYALFAPSGSSWSDLSGETWKVNDHGKNYFSLALLPDNRLETLQQFQRYAHSHVTNSTATWQYDSDTATLTTLFEFTTKAYEGNTTGTLFAMYPHQWVNSSTDLTGQEYQSVRGPMKLAAGSRFETQMHYPGVLPSLPVHANTDQLLLRQLLHEETNRESTAVADTYWFGKRLGCWATLMPIAEQINDTKTLAQLTAQTKQGLENYFTASNTAGELKNSGQGLFAYDANWGTLIGYPASYGSDNDLNDHHFHYGYFIRAAGELARRDPEWASDANWGSMVRLLIRDIASNDRHDKLFPYMRNFDPYAGHSWASGHAKFGDGNNNESSSEAINAWYGIILFGESTGDKELTDLGIYLLTTEIQAINHYWFDVTDQFHHPDYQPSVITMVWGGKGANATWFSGNPELVHGINWLPLTGASLYLGQYVDYCEKNYSALLSENRIDDEKKSGDSNATTTKSDSANWDAWDDLIWMYRALSDPDDAMHQFQHRAPEAIATSGNSLAHALVWISLLQEYGHVDRTITADTTFYAVLNKAGKRIYIAWNLDSESKQVTFSDGTEMQVSAKQLSVSER